jgi:succinylglutamic semialdehyde dehydrogenase
MDGGTGGWFITPGVIEVERFEAGESTGAGADVEVFGPLLRVSVVDSLDEAIAQTNATRFGLAASIFTRDAASIDRFNHEARAGCVNVNAGTAGASSRLPFGGLGRSGNHRPAGSFSLDYCAYPVAGMIETGSAATMHPGMRFEDGWL